MKQNNHDIVQLVYVELKASFHVVFFVKVQHVYSQVLTLPLPSLNWSGIQVAEKRAASKKSSFIILR